MKYSAIRNAAVRVVLAITTLLALVIPVLATSQPARAQEEIEAIPAVAAFRLDMRGLWAEHSLWTRNSIISALAGLPDSSAVNARLARNQADIGKAIAPYYGDGAGNQLAALLQQHETIGVEVVTAAKAGDAARLRDASVRWYTNADAIGDMLANLNSANWPADAARAMMRTHLDLEMAQVNARLQNDRGGDITAADQAFSQASDIADVLSVGIAKQFPSRFAAGGPAPAVTLPGPSSAPDASPPDTSSGPESVPSDSGTSTNDSGGSESGPSDSGTSDNN